MATQTDEVTLDIDELDAAAAKKAAEKDKTAQSTSKADPIVVVDPEITAAATDKPVLTPEAGLEKLQKQLAEEKAARIAADQRAAEAAQSEARARGEAQTSQLDQIKGAIAQVTQAGDVLEAKYAEAAAAQDWGTAAKVQRQMATNATQLAQLEAGKIAIEKAPKPVPRMPTDPIEQYVARIGAEFPRSREWVRSHPEFVTDKEKEQDMLAAHRLALRQGFKADTDAYFRSIEMSLGITSPVSSNDGARPNGRAASVEEDPTADVAATTAAGGRTTAPAAAPVSRSSNGAAGRPNVVKLSAAEVEMAQNMGQSLEDYARNKVALKKEGKLS